jgi:hypothetical protein
MARPGQLKLSGKLSQIGVLHKLTNGSDRPLPGEKEHAADRGLSALHTARRTIQGVEAMLWLCDKGFGFVGAWSVREQN